MLATSKHVFKIKTCRNVLKNHDKCNNIVNSSVTGRHFWGPYCTCSCVALSIGSWISVYIRCKALKPPGKLYNSTHTSMPQCISLHHHCTKFSFVGSKVANWQTVIGRSSKWNKKKQLEKPRLLHVLAGRGTCTCTSAAVCTWTPGL